MNKTECVKKPLWKSAPLKYNQHKPVFTSIHEFCPFFVYFNQRENYNISNIIIIMSIIIITVQKYAQTPQLN